MNGETLNVNINVTIPQLAECLRLLRLIANRQELEMAAIDDQIAALTTEVTNETSVERSALVFIQGVPALIQAAIDKALAAGATDAQLKALSDLGATLKANDDELAAAVVAGTPAAPTP